MGPGYFSAHRMCSPIGTNLPADPHGIVQTGPEGLPEAALGPSDHDSQLLQAELHPYSGECHQEAPSRKVPSWREIPGYGLSGP